VSNRHLALENFQRTAVVAEQGAAGEGPLLRALSDEGRDDPQAAAAAGGAAAAGRHPVFGEDDPRAVVAKRAAKSANALDREVAAALPARYVDDPDFEFGVDARGVDLNAQLTKSGPAARDAMVRTVVPLMREYGAHTRAFVRALLASGRAQRP